MNGTGPGTGAGTGTGAGIPRWSAARGSLKIRRGCAMLLPLVGASTSGELLLSALTRGDEAANVPADEVVRRLGLAAPVMLCLPSELLSSKPSEA